MGYASERAVGKVRAFLRRGSFKNPILRMLDISRSVQLARSGYCGAPAGKAVFLQPTDIRYSGIAYFHKNDML